MSTSEGEDVAIVYIDNSNAFISTQKYSSTKFGYRSNVQDVCRRLKYDQLIFDVACKNKRLLPPINFYVTEPPPLDEVLKHIENCARMNNYRRDVVLRRETETDTALVADAVQQIVTLDLDENEWNSQLRQAGVQRVKNRYLIVFSGDADMLPAVKQALRRDWFVEIWAYRMSSAASGLRGKFKKYVEDDRVKIIHMDDHFDNGTFNEWRYSGRKEEFPRRSLLIKFKTPAGGKEDEIVSASTEVFKIPIQGYFIDEKVNQEFMLVFRTEEYDKTGDEPKLVFNYETNIENDIPLLAEKLSADDSLPRVEQILPRK